MAKANRTAGTKQLGAELDAGLVDQFRAFLANRPESLRWHLEMAIRRHMANPPPVPELPPLPPVTAGPGPAAEKASRPATRKPAAKGKGKGK